MDSLDPRVQGKEKIDLPIESYYTDRSVGRFSLCLEHEDPMNPLSGNISNLLITARRALVTFLAIAFVLPGPGGSEAAAPPSLEIRVVSSRPDMVSGGDTLIEVKAPAGIQKNQIALLLNNK